MSTGTPAPVDDLAAESPPLLLLTCAETDPTRAHIATVAAATTSVDFFPDTRICLSSVTIDISGRTTRIPTRILARILGY
jgi:hypothetical protein